MRTDEEIKAKIQEIQDEYNGNGRKVNVVEAVIDVLENKLEYDEIEDKYFDGHETDRENSGNSAREWLDGDRDDILI